MSNALAKVKEEGGLLAAFESNGVDIQAVSQAVAEAAGNSQIQMSDLERAKLPAGGGLSFTVVDGAGDEVEVKEIVGAIVGDFEVRAFWQKAYSGGNEPPDCFSDDLVTGQGIPGGDCSTCPMAQFGSKTNPDGTQGRGQACAQRRVLLLLTPETALPRVISAPPSSLKRLRKSFLRAAGRGIRMSHALWSFTLEKDKNNDGIVYSAVNVTFIRKLTEDEQKLADSFRQAFEPSMAREVVTADHADESQTEAA